MKLSSKDFQTITHALMVAAERFDDDAKVAGDAGHPRMREQFELQAKESRELRERIEEEHDDET